MRSYLKNYKLRLTTLSPVFIGSGQQINKLEYIFDKKSVYVVDMQKLMSVIIKKNLTDSFQKFMSSRPAPLKIWADNNGLRDYREYAAYELKGIENIDDKRSLKGIDMFMKNAYNEPYVPGSSVKGALRSVILWNELYDDFDGLDKERKNISKIAKEADGYRIKRAADALEKRYFSKRIEDADVSVMRGLIIGDSKPLSLDDIVLCEKVDVHVNGNEKRPNIMRECIRPGRTIELDLTVDERILPYSADDLRKMIRDYSGDYFDVAAAPFPEGDYEENAVFIGGGAGYFSKTVTYSLFEEKDAVDVVSNYLSKTKPREHSHFRDAELGISPHMQKCTRYNGKIYEMGKCLMEIE